MEKCSGLSGPRDTPPWGVPLCPRLMLFCRASSMLLLCSEPELLWARCSEPEPGLLRALGRELLDRLLLACPRLCCEPCWWSGGVV